MWRAGYSQSLRVPKEIAARLCSNKPPGPPSPVSSQLTSSPRPKAEKQRRKREREKAIQSKQQDSVEDQTLNWSEKPKIVYSAHTPPGMKKDTTLPFPSSYSPEYVESCWYQWWEKEGFFSPEIHERLSHRVDRTFSLCIPPPNVTGTLHVGHALTVAVQDALVRWKRMQGYRVLWVPGCDHAGIATQTVVERRLLRGTGKRRQDFTRQEFLQEVWKWKNEKGEEIYHQLRRLGASLDWSRACFTMDPAFSRAVTAAFVRLCDSGLIYRSEGLVNWSCALQSAISDIEVDSVELPGRTMMSVPGYEDQVEFGTMYTFAYPVEGHDGRVAVSTTRPETILGDVAVVVHPDDPRYQTFHGRQCRHPFSNRLIPVITDALVDMDLGTGAMKVTPAHDHTDLLLSRKHSLPHICVIGGDGTMTPSCGQWLEGKKRFDARQLVLDALAEKKLFLGKQNHPMTLPVCSRSGDIIEPLLKKQWFVSCDKMAAKAIQAVEEGQLEIIPQHYTKTWKNWMSSISDWCVSRQLWWGHRIPAYQVQLPDATADPEERWVWGQSVEEARQKAAVKYGVKPEDITLKQDPDVLDTWFSSGLFPFAMLGWPEQTSDLQRFYPNSVLETGSDLIFFWVARMVMLGTELTGQLPFKQVLLHSLVRDKYGRKMSKSLGNVIDPLDMIHGVSLQVSLGAQLHSLLGWTAAERDISLSVSQVLSFRHFCNKMWQTLRFTLGVLGDENAPPLGTIEETIPVGSMERWICSRLYSTVLQCEQAFEAYELQVVTSALHSFWVHSLCDVYIEYVKPVLLRKDAGAEVQADTDYSDASRQVTRTVLYHCVSLSLSLLSPFMPFITEELWQRLQPLRPGPPGALTQTSLCLQPYPRSTHLAHWFFPEEEKDFLMVQEVIRVARSLQAQWGLIKEKPVMWAVCSPSQAQALLHFRSAVWTLGRISSLHLYCPDSPDWLPSVQSTPPPKDCVIGVVDHTCQLHLYSQGGVNVEKQILQLSQRRDKLVPKLEKILRRLQGSDVVDSVPVQNKQQIETQVSALKQELKIIEDQLKVLKGTRSTG
ncbi:valine--tRNA ligase, mitochondrial [Nematolebias whitei]|uniref:valine--tRNA ligase, mitochondrial n=1 Tax=Nematolebias whitei TaxID=451745 RepID=UPI001898DF3F|nr:valine--tRNA ligase, mitochondrial [Nematolebias whitei]